MSYKIPNEKECCDFLTEANGGTNALANSLKTASAYSQYKLLTESRRSGLVLNLYNLTSPDSHRLLTRNHLLAPKCGWDLNGNVVGGYNTGSGPYYKGVKTAPINYNQGSGDQSSEFYFVSSYFIMDSPTIERTIPLYQTSTQLAITNQHPNLISVTVAPYTTQPNSYRVELLYNKYYSSDHKQYTISIPCGIPNCPNLTLKYQLNDQGLPSQKLRINLKYFGTTMNFNTNTTVTFVVDIYQGNTSTIVMSGTFPYSNGNLVSSLPNRATCTGTITNTLGTSQIYSKVRVQIKTQSIVRYNKTSSITGFHAFGTVNIGIYNDYLAQYS